MIVTLWAATIVGMALWGYGLFVTGTAPIIDWKSNAPWWIASYARFWVTRLIRRRGEPTFQ
jgi:hypothetical protein